MARHDPGGANTSLLAVGQGCTRKRLKKEANDPEAAEEWKNEQNENNAKRIRFARVGVGGAVSLAYAGGGVERMLR